MEYKTKLHSINCINKYTLHTNHTVVYCTTYIILMHVLCTLPLHLVYVSCNMEQQDAYKCKWGSARQHVGIFGENWVLYSKDKAVIPSVKTDKMWH